MPAPIMRGNLLGQAFSCFLSRQRRNAGFIQREFRQYIAQVKLTDALPEKKE